MAYSYNYGDKSFLLRNGLQMPAVGLGTFRVRNTGAIFWALDTALQVGYRLFDTASVYGNERLIGDSFRQLLPKHGLLREDIFIITKLAPADHGAGGIERALDRSLENLGFDYVDMYLIHFPGAAKIRADDIKNRTLRHESWLEMNQVYEKGKAHAIGVSNFTLAHLKELKEFSSSKPLVNQVEWHPYYFQPELLEYCNENGIRLQAYSSFGGLSIGQNQLVQEPVVRSIAYEHKISVQQVLLLWSLQKEVAVIPKSITPSRIEKNYELNARLTPDNMKALDGLNRNHKFAWDPSPIP